MFNFENIARVATAAVGALILTTMSVAAAVGPNPVAGKASTNSLAAAAQNPVHADV